MASLNVKVLDMENGEITKVEYEGDTYSKAEGRSKEGDIAKVITPWGDQTKDSFYYVREDETVQSVASFVNVIGERGSADCFSHKVEIFRKESESTYKIGDLAKVTGCGYSHYFDIGDVIKRIEGAGPTHGHPRFKRLSDGYTQYMAPYDIERIGEREDGTELPEGFVKVNRGPQKGDFVKFTENFRDCFTIGKYYEVQEIDEDGDAVITDDDGDEGWAFVDNEYENLFEVYAKLDFIEGNPQVGDKILIVNEDMMHDGYENGDILTVNDVDSADNSVHADGAGIVILRKEFEIIERKAVEDSSDLSKGTKVKLKYDGRILTIESRYPKNDDFNSEWYGKAYLMSDGGWLAESQFEVIEEEALKVGELKVGDYAKVIQKVHGNFGKIVKIVSDSYDRRYKYDTEHLDGASADCHMVDQLVKATNEEVEALLNPPHKFEKGDIVYFEREDGAKGFAEVKDVADDKVIGVMTERNYSGFRKSYFAVDIDGGDSATLIVKANDRVDA